MKKCGRCKERLPVDLFHKSHTRRDGRVSICKYCRAHTVRIEWCDRLERPIRNAEDVTVADMLPVTVLQADRTVLKVLKALVYWMQDGTLTSAQAEAILMHAVDGLPFAEIGRMFGTDHTYASFHYHNGIRNLRNRYGIEVAG